MSNLEPNASNPYQLQEASPTATDFNGSSNILPSDKTAAMWIHLGSLLIGIMVNGVFSCIVPFVFYFQRKHIDTPSSKFVVRHAASALNLYFTAMIVCLSLVLLMLALGMSVELLIYGRRDSDLMLIIALFIPVIMMFCYILFIFVCAIIGAVRANNGQEFSYPLTIKFFNQR